MIAKVHAVKRIRSLVKQKKALERELEKQRDANAREHLEHTESAVPPPPPPL